MGHTSFTKETYLAFKADNRPGPIHMLNLVRLRDRAAYEDGRDVSGEEAYQQYSTLSAPVFQRLGGAIVWRGALELMMIGPQDEAWDISFIAQYPSPGAFLDMLKDPTYREAMVHRQAGVADSRLIRFASMDSGPAFAG
ncbi:MAG: DUF1330 domain-containing protein [Alphaproteobacteria bacterium]|nr:DUF1330 domain-containing protein [Alphaproteobacteria bacterium]